MRTVILTFQVDDFKRPDLERMSSEELFKLAITSRNAKAYKVGEFCDLCNDQELDIDKWWIFTATI